MSFQATILKVMIASPGDVPVERTSASDELYRWNNANAVARRMSLQPVKWETHSSPQMGAHPQALINENLLIDADMVVGIFGQRIGTATTDYISGTVEEIKRHVAARKPAMLYFSNVPVDISTVDLEQYEALLAFKEECRTLGLYWEFETHERFRELFSHHLDIELNKPQYAWLTENLAEQLNVIPLPLSDESQALLLGASNDRSGCVITTTTMEGYSVQSNGESFTDGSNRSAARWKKVLRELSERGLLEDNGNEIFYLTDDGYAEADSVTKIAKEQEALSAISPRALHLLQAAGDRGEITVMRGAERDFIQAGRQPLPDSETPRQMAAWNAALAELVARGFADQRSRALYQVTHSGYEYADAHPIKLELA